MGAEDERAFPFLRPNDRGAKPRTRGLTEIRGPYYTVITPEQLDALLAIAGAYVDSFKIGPPLPLLTKRAIAAYVEVSHRHEVKVSTGGVIEHVLARGPENVDRYFATCAELGFDYVEISAGFLSLPLDDYLRLVAAGKRHGLAVKAEIGIQFGAGGSSGVAELAAEGQGDPAWAVARARRALEAGADLVIMESEGVTEQVAAWRTDVPALFIRELGIEKVQFEAADPPVFGWYVKNFGYDVNLFIDHSQIFQLECLRSGVWGTNDLFGRVISYKG